MHVPINDQDIHINICDHIYKLPAVTLHFHWRTKKQRHGLDRKRRNNLKFEEKKIEEEKKMDRYIIHLHTIMSHRLQSGLTASACRLIYNIYHPFFLCLPISQRPFDYTEISFMNESLHQIQNNLSRVSTVHTQSSLRTVGKVWGIYIVQVLSRCLSTNMLLIFRLHFSSDKEVWRLSWYKPILRIPKIKRRAHREPRTTYLCYILEEDIAYICKREHPRSHQPFVLEWWKA